MADSETTHLTVEGMTCSHCENTIRKYLEGKALNNISVSFANEEVRFDSTEQSVSGIISGIERLGYKVSAVKGERGSRFATVEKRFALTVPFTTTLLLAMLFHHSRIGEPYVQLALCLPVMIIGWLHFGRSALGSIRVGVPNMDVLITIGSSAAFAYSLWGTVAGLGPSYQFYETAATIITLVLLGNVIEYRSVKQTTSAIRELGKLQPQMAKVVLPSNGKDDITELPVDRLIVGDVVQVNTGDQFPADGIVISGSASIDESMMTGESLAVSKADGDEVVGGTLVSDGSVRVRVKRIGENTTLARIIDMVKNARVRKAPMQKLADRISAVFVPAVIGISLVTFFISWLVVDIGLTASVLNSVAVLVIACPCAMGLATPTAVAVGLGRSARRGILIRGADTTEKLRKVKTIVFDKTGTLTTGRFRIGTLHTEGTTEMELKAVIAGLESHSSHPLGKALVDELADVEHKSFTEITEVRGVGIEGKDDEHHVYRIGSDRLAGVNGTPHVRGFDLYVTRNEHLLGALTIQDEVKPEAADVIRTLNASGYRTILLSGDSEAKCKATAEQVGITEYYARQLPEQKLTLIESLSREAPTAMVGDGINDAPALARATVGISLSDATQVAVQSSEVILMGGHLSRLPEVLRIARHTSATIRQNLFWAFFYNVLAIPVAAIGLLSPMIAAFSMAFSDVMVIGNSLRLRVKRL